MQTKRLTLIVPGLLDPVPYLDQLPTQELPELVNFSTLLSRGSLSVAHPLNNQYDSYYACLAQVFFLHERLSLRSKKEQKQCKDSLPIASICYLFDSHDCSENSSVQNKWIMRADPCFVAPDRDQLVLAKTQKLDLSLDEAQQLVAEINSFFHNYEDEAFWSLYAVTAERWYIISEKPIRLQTAPPEKVLGQSIKPFLFNLSHNKKELTSGVSNEEDCKHWLNLFNEFQMILHQSSVNKQRVEQGKISINSLWFWGAGYALKPSPIDVTQQETLVYTDDIYAKGLSTINNNTLYTLPDSYPFGKDVSEHQVILIINDFMPALQSKDIFSWVGLLEQFERNYLVPMVKDLKDGLIKEVEFISPSGTKLFISKKLLKRWWRKKRPFYHFISA